MKLRIYDSTILAIDLRHRRFGYAVYQGQAVLLDWGVRVYPAVGEREALLVSKRLSSLVRLYPPSIIVIKRERWNLAQSNPHMRLLTDVLQRSAILHDVPIRLVEGSDVRASFKSMGCETRNDIAEALARIFPELVSYLPPKRRAWEAEHPRMTVFDAIALGLAYWQNQSTEPPDLLQVYQGD